jgi:glutathione synthase/RimK-type ligase-like ATP-grasp enzyme
MSASPDVLVIYEHPEWQKPLFAALEKRGIPFATLDLKKAAFVAGDVPPAPVVFNQASPSAYVRGHLRAVPLGLAYLQALHALEASGTRVLNGARAFALELSKSTQAALIGRLGLRTPRSIAFNDLDALRVALARERAWQWPALLKPEQGGSGARIAKVGSYEDLRAHVEKTPGIWQPDGLLLLQEYFPHDHARGIVRMEFLGGELLYAMRVVAHGRYNLCPSEVCNPGDPNAVGHCEIPETPAKPVEFHPYAEVPDDAVRGGQRILAAAGIDVGGIEYLESNGERVFYDVNANSNLRPAIAQHFGFDPFDRVATWLEGHVRLARGSARG